MNIIAKLKQPLLLLSAASIIPPITVAYADSDPLSLTPVLTMVTHLLRVFFGAGILLLAYSVIVLILAFKNEDAESKVQAASQIAVAIVCITLSSTVTALLNSVNVNYTYTNT